jgi:transcriptional regulator with XRE-family HTH domain
MLDLKRVGINILSLRKELNLTQTELADLVNVSHQAVSKWERGECLPDIEVLLLLAMIFNTKVDNLLSSDDYTNSPIAPLHNSQNTPANPWNNVLELIKKQISKPSFDTWFKYTSAEYDGLSLTVFSPTLFATEWLYNRYSTLITQALDEVTRVSNTQIKFQVKQGSRLNEPAYPLLVQ